MSIFQNALNDEILLILGEFGKGKTLTGVFIILLRSILHKRKIILSNTPLFFPDNWNINYKPLTHTSQLENIKEDTEVFLDEGHRDLNSHNTRKPSNEFLTSWGVDLRKINTGITTTTQYPKRIDLRIFEEFANFKIIPKFINVNKKDGKPINYIIDLFICDMFESEELQKITVDLKYFTK